MPVVVTGTVFDVLDDRIPRRFVNIQGVRSILARSVD